MFTTTTPSKEAEKWFSLVEENASPITYTIPNDPRDYLYSDCTNNKGIIAVCVCGWNTSLTRNSVADKTWCINKDCEYRRSSVTKDRYTPLEKIWIVENAGCTVSQIEPGRARTAKIFFTCLCGEEYSIIWDKFQNLSWCTNPLCSYTVTKKSKTVVIPTGFVQTSVTPGRRTDENQYHFTCPVGHHFTVKHIKAVRGIACNICDRHASFSADYRAAGCELLLTPEELAEIENSNGTIISFTCPDGHIVETLTKNEFSTRRRQNCAVCMQCVADQKQKQKEAVKVTKKVSVISDHKTSRILAECTPLGVVFNDPPDRTPKGLRGVCICGVPCIITFSSIEEWGNKWCSYTECDFYRGDTRGQISLREEAEARGCVILKMIGTEAVMFACACGEEITTSREASFCSRSGKGWCNTGDCPNRGSLYRQVSTESVAQLFEETGWVLPFGHGTLLDTASRTYATCCENDHIVTGKYMDFQRQTVVCRICTAVPPVVEAVILPPPDETAREQWNGENDYNAVIDHCRPTVDSTDPRWIDHRGNGKNRYIELTDSNGNIYYEVEVNCTGYGILAMKISPESLPILLQTDRNWYVQKSANKKVAYVRNGKRKNDTKIDYLFHQAVTGGKWAQVDHINHNGLDNRIENLRDGSGVINVHNRRISSTNTTGYKCITRNSPNHKTNGSWVVNIRRKTQRPHKKTFSWSRYNGEQSALLAAINYRNAYLETHGTPTEVVVEDPEENKMIEYIHDHFGIDPIDGVKPYEIIERFFQVWVSNYHCDTGEMPDENMESELYREATKSTVEIIGTYSHSNSVNQNKKSNETPAETIYREVDRVIASLMIPPV